MNWHEAGEFLDRIPRFLLIIVFGLTLCYGFLNKTIDGAIFVGIVGPILGYVLRGREDEKATKATTDAVKSTAVETAAAIKKEG